ncbi:uncharacterized protein [Mytilus edulis]|uniref:uncharacterized protein n=1 Tax=Mytilus edulis TaxID=6550 RepID=UPI0039F07F2F
MMGSARALYISKTLFLVLVLLTNYSSGYYIRQQSFVTDIEPSERQNTELQRKTLIEILQNLQEFSFQEEKRKINTKSSFQVKKDRRQMDSVGGSVNKRDYGIMPPWNEMCRMMRVAFCVRHRK